MSVRRFRVSGRVQGVGFRFFAIRLAPPLKLLGGVRNDADGSVTVVAAGEDEALDQLARGLAEGPRAALVARVESSELAELPADEPFDYRF